MLRATVATRSVNRFGILPITALEVLETPSASILAIGQGSQLHLKPLNAVPHAIDISENENSHLTVRYTDSHAEVLVGQAIHGIVLLDTFNSEDHVHLTLLVYGGSQVALVAAIYYPSRVGFEVLDRLQIPNERVITTNTVPNSKYTVVCLTSYNTVSHIGYRPSSRHLRQEVLSNKASTFLYSGTIQVVSPNHYIVASGTALGEVLLWTCRYDLTSRSWKTIPFRQFEGHRGSIFGVSISSTFLVNGQRRQMVASCSDDRTIRLWDISKPLDESPEDDTKDAHDFLVSTDCSGMIWGHLSRIWTVDFLQDNSASTAGSIGWLISTGEDGTVQSWSVELDHQSWKLANICQDRHHAGKNIWSHCIRHLGRRVDVYSGGADGRVVRRPYGTTSKAVATGPTVTQALSPLLQSPTPDNKQCTSVGTFKYYQLLDHDSLVCSTDTGLLLRGRRIIDHMDWALVDDVSCQSSLFATDCSSGSVFVVDQISHHLTCLNLTSGSTEQIKLLEHGKVAFLSAASFLRDRERILCALVSYYSNKQIQVWMIARSNVCQYCVRLDLPDAFIVSAVLYDAENDTLVCGSRAGALVAYTNITTDPRRTSCLRHAHGSDAVTQIVKIDSQEVAHSLYLTTGRDGYYCVHRVNLKSAGVETVHRSMPPLGPYIEGVHILTASGEAPRVILHGFRSTEFVVWDETEQRQLFAIHCGGAHRSWTFHLDQSGRSATFVWTQAGKFNYKRLSSTDHEVLQSGSHGREIKALAVHRLERDKHSLIATGSEDTNIQLMLKTADKPALRTLSVLRKHMTGLQDLKFSPNGRVLFSAAGMEELFAWNIMSIPVLGCGVTFASSLPRTDAQSDARIMAIDVSSDQDMSYNLIAALSNGHFKLLQYQTESAAFKVLKAIDVGNSICLTQARFLADQPNLFVGAATDGHARVYDHSSNLLQDRKQVHQNSVTALQTVQHDSEVLMFVTGGDDNALTITLNTDERGDASSNSSSGSKSLRVSEAHAAALTALALLRIDKRTYYILTAGNDQRVKIWSLTLVRDPYSIQMDDVQLNLLGDEYTNVADISGLEILERGNGGSKQDIESKKNLNIKVETDSSDRGDADAKVPSVLVSVSILVVGVGMEILDLCL